MKNIIKSICEKILASARRDRGASGPLAGRCDADAPVTLLLATSSVAQNRRSAVHRVGGFRPVRRVCTLRTPRLTVSARRFGWFTHSLLHAPTGVCGILNFCLPAQKKTKSVVVLRTKVLSITTLRLPATRRAQRCNASQAADSCKTKRFGVLRANALNIYFNFRKENRSNQKGAKNG